MLFATYQSVDQVGKIANDEIDPYSIWAVPAEDLQDLFISLFCSAPNRMEALIFFNCEKFIRIDKVKWYQTHKNRTPGQKLNPRDCASDEVDNLHSEFLVEGITPESIRMMVPIVQVGESSDILERGSLKFNGPAADLLKAKAASICNDLYFPAEENKRLGMSESYATYRSEFQPKKTAFELVYLPLAFKILTAEPGQFTVNVAYMMHMLSYHARDFYRLNNDFTRWSFEDCSLERFDAIVEQMRHYILDNEAVAERIVMGTPIGRNDPCPCGSGKKYKKCHGMWA